MNRILLIIVIATFSLSLGARGQGFEPLSSTDLITEAKIADVQLSPGGDWMIAIDNFGDSKTVSVIQSHPAEVKQVISLRSMSNFKIQWLNNDHFVIGATQRRGVSRVSSIFKVQEEGTVEQLVPFFHGEFIHFDTQAESGVLVKLDRGRSYSLFRVSANEFSPQGIEDAENIVRRERALFPPAYDPVSKNVLFLSGTSSGSLQIKAISMLNGDESRARLVTGENKVISPIAFISASQWLVITDEQTPRRVLQYYNPVSRELGDILYQSDEHDVRSAELDSNGAVKSVSYLSAGQLKTHYLDSDLQRFYQRIAATYPNASFVATSQTFDEQHILLLGEGPQLEPSYFLYHGEDDTLQLLQSKFSGLDTRRLSPSQRLEVASVDGTIIESFLTMPLNTEPKGLLVMPHGGPIGIADNNLFNPEVQYFASRGFAVLRTNFRGSEGYGREFRESGRGELGHLIEDDIMASLYAVLEDHPFENICAVGASYGAYSSMMLAIRAPELFDCAVGSFGIYDLALGLSLSNRHTGELVQERLRRVFGDHDVEALMATSPVYRASEISVPVLLVAGARDLTTPPEHTYRLETTLKLAGYEPETLIYKRAGHGHSSLTDRRHHLALIYDFVRRSMEIDLSSEDLRYQIARSALAEDYMLLGQRTQSSRTEARGVLAEPKSTAYFFEQALDLGAQSATFELGKRLLDAEDDYFDQARGLELLEEATELGQWRAEVELGLHSLRGVLVEQDYQRAGELIQAGYARSDDSREHQLPLAELFCSAPEPVQNLERCTLELKRRGTGNRSVQSDFQETVGRIYENLDPQSDAIVPIRDYLIEYLNLSEERTTLDGVEAGVGNYEFDRQYGRNGRFEPMSKPESFSLSENLGRTMGLRVKPDTPFSMSEEAKTALILIWKYPDLNGTQRSTARMVYGRDRWFEYTRRLEEEQALGDYQIEVRNLYNEPLYNYSYSITE